MVLNLIRFGLILSILLGSYEGFADELDYKLVAFENDTYRDWTFEELANAIGSQSIYLPTYKCDGVKELDIFAPPFLMNANKDSLKVKAFESDVLLTYKNGAYFDQEGNQKKPRGDAFLKAAASALAELEKLPSSRTLLRLLEQSPYEITLERGRPHFVPTVPGGRSGFGIYMASAMMFFKTLRKTDEPVPFNQIGVGGSVKWTPDLNDLVIESDGVKRSVPAYFVLGHEMFHAYDGVRGLLDRQNVDGVNYEFAEVAEYRGVGFENRLRKESGLKYRKYYGAESGADFLTDAGEPIEIPAICIP